MSIVPTSDPSMPYGLVQAIGQQAMIEDPGVNAPAMIGDCGAYVVIIRDPAIARYNDRLGVRLDDGAERWWWGNADPGATGINKAIGKPYARVRGPVIAVVRGRHALRPNRFRQANASAAKKARLGDYFTDFRADGSVAVDRMSGPNTIAYTQRGHFSINFHDGADHKTGSAGCITMPPAPYLVMRDLVYAAMDRTRQTFLPIVLVAGALP